MVDLRRVPTLILEGGEILIESMASSIARTNGQARTVDCYREPAWNGVPR